MAETTIRAGAPLVTLINVFTVDPKDQEHLVEWQCEVVSVHHA